MELLLLLTLIIVIVLAFLKLFAYIAPFLLAIFLFNLVIKMVSGYKKQKEFKESHLSYDDEHYGSTLIDEDFVLGKREKVNTSTVHSVNDDRFFRENHEVVDATIVEE